jgi:hypothetical protein
MTHVFQYPYIYIKMYIITISRGKIKKKTKKQYGGQPKTTGRQPYLAHSHGPAPEASASYRRFKMRSAIGKASWANSGSWGMSETGNMLRSTWTLEIPSTSCDNRLASTTHLPLILSTCVQPLSSSADRFCPSVGCRPHSSSYASIAYGTSKSVSCR